jgi:fluoride exporter
MGMKVRRLTQIGFEALGSAVGGLTRCCVGAIVTDCVGTGFPYGTMFVNISGSLFLGWFTALLSKNMFRETAWFRPDDLRQMIAVGFTGAYTTFSTFEYESHAMLGGSDGLGGTIYIFLSLFLGLLAVRLGVMLAKWQTGGPR